MRRCSEALAAPQNLRVARHPKRAGHCRQWASLVEHDDNLIHLLVHKHASRNRAERAFARPVTENQENLTPFPGTITRMPRQKRPRREHLRRYGVLGLSVGTRSIETEWESSERREQFCIARIQENHL